MGDFNKTRKPEPQESKGSTAASGVALPPGCTEEMLVGNEPIAEIGIGETLTGHIMSIKSVKTSKMQNPNNLITFNDEAYGPVKFWSSGALNQLLGTGSHLEGKRITVQRIEDEDFKKGRGQNWRIFIRQ